MRPGPRPVLALLGLRGSGKSTLGRALAAALGRPFLDLDQELVRLARQAGFAAASAGELLQRHGAAEFRELEARALRRVLEPAPEVVLATGGGVVERDDNVVWLARAARCVLLVVPPAVLAERRAADPTLRPPLAGRDAREESELLWARREARYRALAELVLEPGSAAPAELVAQLLARLEDGRKGLRVERESPDAHG